jgi:hypothetical protein
MRWWGYILLGGFIWFMLSWFASSVGLAEDNDTAFTTNILPNAGTATSNYSNSNLDGVASSTTSLTNNSTHNGFTVTCETEVNNACGQANTSVGEIEASHDLTLTATGSLVGIEGDSTPDGVTHTSTQLKLNGGINLSSSIAVQNCEWNQSAFKCGSSAGAVDSYTLTMKVLDADENVLATSTQTRTTDSGYNNNERIWNDSLHYNGVHANKYEWSWTGVDGSESTSVALRGTNLLGAEMALDFPTEDYEPLSAQEIKDMNEGLGTANLNESEIWNVISGLEESIGERLHLETNGAVVSVEITENFEIAVKTSKEATVKEVVKVQEVVQEMNKTKTVETMKKEVIEEVIKESKQEEPKENVKEEATIVANKPKEETNKETTSIAKKESTKEKKVETKENVKPELKVIMAKVDAKIKNPVKNLELKNLIKMDRMIDSDISLVAYNNVEFYKSKDIYLNQIEIFDNRSIYANIDLVKYTANDIMGIKIKKLNEIKYRKNMLLLQIQELKNG